MKTRLSVFTVFLIVVMLSGCATPAVVTKVSSTETSLPVDEDVIFPTETVTLEPTFTPTIEPTPTELPTPTVTPTPEPILWCSDVIENCYFIGSEFAELFAVTTLPCFEHGGECYPPIEVCDSLPPSVPHVLVEDWAEAWEQEVTGNSKYSLLDPDLYDPEIEYCFVDENVAQIIRDLGNESFQAQKLCLNDDSLPCNLIILLSKGFLHDDEDYPLTFTNDNFLLYGYLYIEDRIVSYLEERFGGFHWHEQETLDSDKAFCFAYVFTNFDTLGTDEVFRHLHGFADWE